MKPFKGIYQKYYQFINKSGNWLIALYLLAIIVNPIMPKLNHLFAVAVMLALYALVIIEVINLNRNKDRYSNLEPVEGKWTHGKQCWLIGLAIWLPYIVLQSPPSNQIAEVFRIIGITAFMILVTYIMANIQYHTREDENQNNKSYHILIRVAENFFIITIGSAIIAGIKNLLKFGKTASKNQQAIDKIVKGGITNDIWIIIITVIVAPIIEELTFRMLMIGPRHYRGVICNKHHRLLMLIISIIAFGLGHMYSQIPQMIGYIASLNMTGVGNLSLDFLQYAWTGLVLGIDYYRHSDIRSTVFTHGLYNGVAIVELMGTITVI